MSWHGLFVCNESPFCLSHSRMRPVIRFAVVLVVGLALVAAIASILFNKTAHSWFENDVRLRAEIAVKGARQAFVERWNDRKRLESLLTDMTHDERILAAAACSSAPESLPGGDVYVSAIPILDEDQVLGFVVLVHDLSFIARREARTREFLFVMF